MNWYAIRYATRHVIRYATRRALTSPRGSFSRGWHVGWRLACQLADRRGTVEFVCPECRNIVAKQKQRDVTEAERARAEGPRPVLVCGSRRCGAGVRTMDVVWIREEETHV